MDPRQPAHRAPHLHGSARQRPPSRRHAFASVAIAVALWACQRDPTIVIRFEPQDLATSMRPAPRDLFIGADALAPPAAASGAGAAKVKSGAPSECAHDADCVTARADCCGCTSGGKAIALPRHRLAAHEASLRARCTATMCIQMISNDPSCGRVAACREGRCVLAERS